MAKLLVEGFWLPKSGNKLEEYEDAWAYSEEAQRLALADGASDGFESRLWAQALVQAFTWQAFTPENVIDWLKAPAEIWKNGIRWDQLTWNAEEKARRGAFATLLGVALFGEKESSVSWRAMALGDTCLFHVREEKIITCFPLERSADFNTTPSLLSNRFEYSRRSLEGLGSCTGELLSDDLLILATDALSAWFLHEVEAGERPWQRLVGMDSDEFSVFVEQLRQQNEMRNDDVTLLLVKLDCDVLPRKSGKMGE